MPARPLRRPLSTRLAALGAIGLLALTAACGSSAAGKSSAATSTTAAPGATTSAAPNSAAPTDAGHHVFGVGTRTITVVDSTRPTVGDPGRHIAAASSRTLPVLLVYPTDAPASDAAIPPDTADANVAVGRFPLIEFSHGVTASGPAYKSLLVKFARAGYVVAAPTFPMTSGAGGWTDIKDYQNQPADVSFVLTRVSALNTTAGDPLFGHLDLAKIAVAGHSLGAITTLGFLNTCCPDQRVKAAVALSGILLPFKTGDFKTPPPIPVLLVHGQQDRTVPYGGSETAFNSLTGPRAFLTIPEGSHIGVMAPKGLPTLTSDVIIAFLDRELRHDPSRWNALAPILAGTSVGRLAVAGGLPAPVAKK